MKTAATLLTFFALLGSVQAQDIFVPRELKAKPVFNADGTRRASVKPVPHSTRMSVFKPAPLPPPPPKTVKIMPYPTTEFEPYRGQQSNDWPLNDKPPWATNYAVPIYLEMANRRFDIIGTVYVHLPPPEMTNPQGAAMKNAALVARAYGADALILRSGVGRISEICYAVGTAIRWKR